jgi:ABC-type antimicrobial peptide transport system permease subunit
MALGATRVEVFRLVMRQGMTLVVIGVVLGIALSLGSTRVIGRLLFGVAPTDAAVFGVVTGLLVASGVVACLVPARRATRVDPIVTLRSET